MIAPGDRFGLLVAERKLRFPPRKGSYYLCKCDCGNDAVAYIGHLLAGNRVSCGCLVRADKKHGMSRSGEYKSWDAARARCFNEKNDQYNSYGGRGISMCDEWRNSFSAFFRDMGYRPAGTSLDRINNNGNYEPGNCRWATASQQVNNRRPLKTAERRRSRAKENA